MLWRRFRVAVLIACVDRCTGRAFGLSRVEPVVTIGGVGCTDAKWVSDEQIECTTPPTSSGVHDLVVRVGVNEVSKKDAFTSLTPVISTLIPPSGKKVGGYPRCLASPRLVVLSCGLQGRTRAYLDVCTCSVQRACHILASTPMHRYECRMPGPASVCAEALFNIPKMKYRPKQRWSRPSLSWLRFLRSHSCAQSAAIHRILLSRVSERAARRDALDWCSRKACVICSTVVTIVGRNFGMHPQPPTLRVMFGAHECTNVAWQNNSTITCVSPAGLSVL